MLNEILLWIAVSICIVYIILIKWEIKQMINHFNGILSILDNQDYIIDEIQEELDANKEVNSTKHKES